LVAVDVKNVFNTLSWSVILKEADIRGIPKELLTLLGNYFKDWRIIIRTTAGTVRRHMYTGVPQGSILEPLLWNLVYDGLLKELKAIPCLVDDLTVILDVAKHEDATKLSDVMGVMLRWCIDCELKIAREETDILDG
jgi:retron-type reverse transcriptase